GFEAREEREGIGRGPGEARQNLVVVQAAQLAGGAFQDLATEAHLPIAGHHDLVIAANTNHRRRSNSLSHCECDPILTHRSKSLAARWGRRFLGTCNISCFGWKCPVRPIRPIAQRWKPKKIRQRYLCRLARSAQFE